jgi:importin subunit alpha-6/7
MCMRARTQVLEQAIWVLGNLAGESVPSRDAVLAADVIPPLLQCLASHFEHPALLRIGSWALSTLLDGQPRPVLSSAASAAAVPALARLLRCADSEVLSHTCWALR